MIVQSDKILSLRVFAKQRCAMRAGRTIWNVDAHCDNGKRSGSRASAASKVKVELASNERLRSLLPNESPVTLALLQAWATPVSGMMLRSSFHPRLHFCTAQKRLQQTTLNNIAKLAM
jgi:hypothetical protein